MASFTSYLRLNDRVSQVWLNIYTLALILAILKLMFFYKSIRDAINFAKVYTVTYCESFDSLYSKGLTDTPHYMGLMGNYLIEKSLVESVKMTLSLLSSLVYAGEEVAIFMVNLYLGTYACLIVSAIDATVDAATNTTESIIKLVNSSVVAFSDELEEGLTDISQFINKITSAASKIESLLGDDSEDSNQLKKVNLTVASLRSFRISSSISTKLQEISDKTPDFKEVKNMTETLISIPFEKVRSEIKQLNATTIVGSPNLLFVPPLSGNQSNASGICPELKIDNIYLSFEKTLRVAILIIIVLTVLAALAAMIPSAWRDYKLWSRLEAMEKQYREAHDAAGRKYEKGIGYLAPFELIQSEKPYDVISSYHQCFNQWNQKVSNLLLKLYCTVHHRKLNASSRVKVQWLISYLTSERALIVLGVGTLALLTCILQFIIIAVLQRFVKDDNNFILTNLANSTIAASLQQDMTLWSQNTNSFIASTEQSMNQRAFGWVNETTVSVNSTVNKMLSEIDSTLQDAFNDTVLLSPMSTIVDCTIGNKLLAIEKAMTWINEKASFSLPRISPSEVQALFGDVANSQNSTAGRTAAAANKDALLSQIRATLLKILKNIYATTMWELTIAFILIGVWALQLPIALLIMLYRCRSSVFGIVTY